jgi:hypothetical protein
MHLISIYNCANKNQSAKKIDYIIGLIDRDKISQGELIKMIISTAKGGNEDIIDNLCAELGYNIPFNIVADNAIKYNHLHLIDYLIEIDMGPEIVA